MVSLWPCLMLTCFRGNRKIVWGKQHRNRVLFRLTTQGRHLEDEIHLFYNGVSFNSFFSSYFCQFTSTSKSYLSRRTVFYSIFLTKFSQFSAPNGVNSNISENSRHWMWLCLRYAECLLPHWTLLHVERLPVQIWMWQEWTGILSVKINSWRNFTSFISFACCLL